MLVQDGVLTPAHKEKSLILGPRGDIKSSGDSYEEQRGVTFW